MAGSQIASRNAVAGASQSTAVTPPAAPGSVTSPPHEIAGRRGAGLAIHPRSLSRPRRQRGDRRQPRCRLAVLPTAQHQRQKKSVRAAEQERADVVRARRRWMREQGLFDPAHLVFVDETATSTNMARLRGRCERGLRLIGHPCVIRHRLIATSAITRSFETGSCCDVR